MMKASLPESQSNPIPLSFPLNRGAFVGWKSIPSPDGATHFPMTGLPPGSFVPLSALGSQYTSFFFSDHGFPEGSAEARLYMMWRFAGQANPQFGEIQSSPLRDFARFFPSSGITPVYIHAPQAVEPSSFSTA